jgi:hypothetical protein
MTDTMLSVEIGLLKRHPELPLPQEIIARFAEHHSQSQARQRSHDELVASDSHLHLEDFGSLAASALVEAQEDARAEESHPFSPNESLASDPAASATSEQEAQPKEASESEAPMPSEVASQADGAKAEAAPGAPSETAPKKKGPKRKRSRKRKAKKKG